MIPDSLQEPQAFCKVISVGKDVKYIEPGDITVSHMRSGMDVLIEKQIVKVLKEDEVYGILTDKKTIDLLENFEVKEKEKFPIV